VKSDEHRQLELRVLEKNETLRTALITSCFVRLTELNSMLSASKENLRSAISPEMFAIAS